VRELKVIGIAINALLKHGHIDDVKVVADAMEGKYVDTDENKSDDQKDNNN
jgi:hypothetical protein